METNQRGFLLLDVLSACALFSILTLFTYSANKHFDTTQKKNKVRMAAEILAQDLRRLQRTTMFQCTGMNLALKVTNIYEYRIYDGITLNKTVNFSKLGYEGVYFSKKLNSSRFIPIGAPVYTGDYELKHRDLPNFSCTLSIQPVTGRVIVSEVK